MGVRSAHPKHRFTLNGGDTRVNFKTRAIGAFSALAVAGGLVAFAAPAANAVDTPAGSCSGSRSLGKLIPNLGDQTAPIVITTSLLSNLQTGAPAGSKFGGFCAGILVPFNNPGGPIPGIVTPKAIASKLTGVSSCASGAIPVAADITYANRFAITGKQTVTMSQVDTLLKPFQIQAYVTIKGFVVGSLDVVEVTGLITKGPSVGATVSGQLYEDPISKLGPISPAGPIPPNPKPAGYTGYGLDIITGNPLGCTDGVPGNAAITLIEVGDGISMLGNPASGLSFSYIGV